MKVLYALICEDADARDDGRLDVRGVFHQLYAEGFPARQEAMTLAIAIEWEPHERGIFQFAVDLLDPTRSPVLTISAETDVQHHGGPSEAPLRSQMVLPLSDVVFPREGTYVFELKVGEERRPLAPLHLIRHRQS
ncbi:MAG TPA: hypothetical protein VFX98_05505 [Longimicrobiaceae bacterium]|nr:hypothetical protein [Longimicrobiaceae bacterium]